jgi:hypothetical protein
VFPVPVHASDADDEAANPHQPVPGSNRVAVTSPRCGRSEQRERTLLAARGDTSFVAIVTREP